MKIWVLVKQERKSESCKNKQKLPNPSPMMSTVAEKLYGFVIYLVKWYFDIKSSRNEIWVKLADFCQVFFVVKIENLHEVISFYQLLRLKLASLFDI